MNLKITGMVLAGALLGVLATASYAQDTGTQNGQGRQGRGQRGGMRGNRGFGGQGGGFGGQGGGFGGGIGGFGRQRGGQPDHNPMITHVMELINRADVQNNIHLDLNQKTALTKFQGDAQRMVRDQMQQMFQTMRQQNGGGRNGAQNGQGGGQAGQNGQADRNAQREQMRTQMQAQREAIQTKITTGLNEVLRPDQVARLHQLDLQWRGVLSLADPKVAEEVKATPEHRTALSTLVTEYQTKSREASRQLFQSMRGNRQQNGGRGNGFGAGTGNGGNAAGNGGNAANNGAAGNTANGRNGQNLQNGQNPFVAIERADAAARKEAEDKALALLSANEKANWTKAQGAPFTFRTDLQTTRR